MLFSFWQRCFLAVFPRVAPRFAVSSEKIVKTWTKNHRGLQAPAAELGEGNAKKMVRAELMNEGRN